MRILKSLVVFSAACLLASCATSKQTVLFNGKDLSGWEIYGTEKWYVEDGILISESGPEGEYGYLGTKDFYKDFELTAEFKQEQDGNSGIFIRFTVKV